MLFYLSQNLPLVTNSDGICKDGFRVRRVKSTYPDSILFFLWCNYLFKKIKHSCSSQIIPIRVLHFLIDFY